MPASKSLVDVRATLIFLLIVAAVNLTLHISNILLIYHLALRLYRSVIGARWAAFGFALLFPANSWAVMWISTRAHLLVTLFYLAALLTTLWYLRTERHRVIAIIAIVLFAALSIFSKECGLTVPGAIALVILSKEMAKEPGSIPRLGTVGLFAILFAVLLFYLGIRAQSGAMPITFSGNSGYFYALSPKLLLEHLLRYAWRTFGLFIHPAANKIGHLFLFAGDRRRSVIGLDYQFII
ncbi:MAG: hypothetical protein L0220_07395 [Acidobacteria bacterium]|nr:hypothetical protein [Acidobacteriota bacterium]